MDKTLPLLEHPIAKDIDTTKNLDVCLKLLTISSSKKLWWLCKLGHEWQTRINNRCIMGTGCPYCSGQKVAVGFNDLTSQSPDIAREFDEVKNAPLVASQVNYRSNKKYWWNGSCGHSWYSVLSARTSRGAGCPYCAGNKVLIGFNDLATTNPELLGEWHPTKNLPLLSTSITNGGSKKIWWQGTCGHEWDDTVPHRRDGRGCPFCSNHRIKSGFNTLKDMLPELESEWNSEKNIGYDFSLISSANGYKAWWICSLGHEWQTWVYSRKGGAGCPTCFKGNKSEQEESLFLFLSEIIGDSVEIHRNRRDIIPPYELDIFIPSMNIGFEYNGLYWHSEAKKNKNYHYEKMKSSNSQGINLIQIWEDDWLDRRQLMEDFLKLIVTPSDKNKRPGETRLVKETLERASSLFFAISAMSLSKNDKIFSLFEREHRLASLGFSETNEEVTIKAFASSDDPILSLERFIAKLDLKDKKLSFLVDNSLGMDNILLSNEFTKREQLEPDSLFSSKQKRFKQKHAATDVRVWDAGKTRWVKKLKN